MENNNAVKEFTLSIDFYWRSVAVYSFVLIFYSLMIGSWEEGGITLKIWDPIVILLLIFIIVSLVSLISRYYRKKTIILDNEHIIFKSRFGKKVFKLVNLEDVTFTKEKIFKTRRKYSIIKLKFHNRKRLVRIRPSGFDNEEELVEAIYNIWSKRIRKNKITTKP